MTLKKLILLSIFLYICSVAIVFFDEEFSYRWIAFISSMISTVLIPISILIRKFKKLSWREIEKKERYSLIFVIVIAAIACFVYLKDYPFVAIYDQIRDGGLNAAQIADGTIKNIFSYGRYASHGLIIPTFASFFYHIFGNTVFTFRILSGVLIVLSTLVIYLTIRIGLDRKTALFSSLVFITLPLTLYYSRTEIVVAFSIFLFSLIFAYLSIFLKKRTYEMYIIGGLLLGFSGGFHTSIRTVAIISLGLVLIVTLIGTLRKKNFKKNLISLVLLIVFLFVGFGPRILFTTPEIFFQTRSLSENTINSNYDLKNKLILIGGNYKKSLLVYFFEPTLSTHFPDFKPILNPLTVLFFLIGIGFSFIKNNKLIKLTVFFALIIPLTNSAITDIINSDNRLGPLFAVSGIITGFGIVSIAELIPRKQRKLVEIFLALILILQGVNFFLSESADKHYKSIDYLSMYAINSINSDEEFRKINKVCIFANPSFYEYSKLYHVQEQFEYFLPGKYIYIAQRNDVLPNEIYLSRNCNGINTEKYRKISYCLKKEKFICPDQPLFLYKEIENGSQSIKETEDFFIINPTPAFIP